MIPFKVIFETYIYQPLEEAIFGDEHKCADNFAYLKLQIEIAMNTFILVSALIAFYWLMNLMKTYHNYEYRRTFK